MFRKAIDSSAFFKTAYGYAVFPTIGKGGIGVGGAYGEGRVYEKGKYIGNIDYGEFEPETESQAAWADLAGEYATPAGEGGEGGEAEAPADATE